MPLGSKQINNKPKQKKTLPLKQTTPSPQEKAFHCCLCSLINGVKDHDSLVFLEFILRINFRILENLEKVQCIFLEFTY